jgi:hypothetical protein
MASTPLFFKNADPFEKNIVCSDDNKSALFDISHFGSYVV